MPFYYINEEVCLKSAKRNDWQTGMSRNVSLYHEIDILKRLNNNFECICKKKKKNHFPTFIDIKKNCKEFWGGVHGMKLSYCGKCLKFGKKMFEIQGGKHGRFYNKAQEDIDDIEEQINCICHNLKKNNIIQIDIGWAGNNLTIKDKTLHMIDFGLAFQRDKPLPKGGCVMKGVVQNGIWEGFSKSLHMKYYYESLPILLKWIIDNNKKYHEGKYGMRIWNKVIGKFKRQLLEDLDRNSLPGDN